MAISQTTANIQDALVLNQVSFPEIFNTAFYRADARYNILSQLSTKMNEPFGGSKQVGQVKFQVGSVGGNDVYATVTSAPTTDAQGNLVVTLSSAENFRPGDTVQDGDNNQGQVLSVDRTLNTITLGTTDDSSTWSTTTDFTVGMNVLSYGMASISKGSTGRESLNIVPELDYNYTQIMRDTWSTYRRDNVKTYIEWRGKWWTTSQIEQTNMRYMKKMEYTLYFGNRGIKNAGSNNEYTYTGGVRWNIINRNPSNYFPLTAQMTVDDLTDFIRQFQINTASSVGSVVALMGAEAMANLQSSVLQPYILQAGNRNTFGGMSVEGLNTKTFSYLDLEMDFVNWKLLDSPGLQNNISSVTGLGKNSSSILFLSTDPIDTPDGTQLPCIMPKHFGNSEYLTGFLTGMYDDTFAGSRQLAADLNNQLASNPNMVVDTDTMSYHIYSDKGWWIEPQNMGLIELVV